MSKKEATQKRGASSRQNSQPKGRAAMTKPKTSDIEAGRPEMKFTPLADVVAKVDDKGMPYLTFKNLKAERAALQSDIGPKLTLEEFLKGSGQS